ncbi:DNA excision repair protein ERCC-6-like 2 [Penicillium taxi]|uniref:DNA excision repair protein ERCC-6-like 2 n=1 Tax=Penicillium taxi TaxID=168475 RepID=UPI0025459CF0|nr:DNA excision repair protein ERCC-6-like 2 [Penicillium taxi]KAJ5888381.1 DNA excision repair protein ERCC-6-like 2 [Penicillium taxi]
MDCQNYHEVISLDSDDDDLEATPYLGSSTSMHDASIDTFDATDTFPAKAPANVKPKQFPLKSEHDDTPLHPSSEVPTVIESTDDESDDFNDGEEAYKKFKGRKSLKRKQTAAATRRAMVPKKKSKDDVIVGRVKLESSKEKSKRLLREYGDASSDEDLLENLPKYLQQRRDRFDLQKEHLKEHGLKLPPSYDCIDFSDNERLEHLQEKPSFPGREAPREYKDIELPCSMGLVPAPIAQWLRQYQVDGAAFLHELFVYQKGGILGDDMGLGKTIQVISFLTAAYGKTADERDAKRMRKMRRADNNAWYPRTLIICPGTLISNWIAELQRWGWWNVDVYHGPSKDIALHAAKSGRVEIMITTYTTYANNKDEVNMVEWDCVVADECHKIKEPKAIVTQAMNEVNALCRIGLTGTAIQNRYEELWTLLNWTNPGKIGPLSAWKAQIAVPLKIGQSHDATVNQLSKARRVAKMLAENLLPHFFLRRMKSLIADQLPKKSDRVVFCPLTETQADAYENFLDSVFVQIIQKSTETCDCGSKKKAGWCCYMFIPGTSIRWQSYVFPAITILQKISNHIAIMIPQGNDPREKQEKEKEMLQVALPDQWEALFRSRDSILNFANPEFCGKWKVLRKLLKWWHSNGDKVLVFSHSLRLLKMLQMLFNNTSYTVSYLDGSMKYEDRTKAVDEFNSDPNQFVFLISTKAGGVGLNIVSANKVVVVDPNWNPSFDLQAQDRAYRIGQLRDVEVFRLISAGTIEEIVYARQIYKQQQAEIGYNASSERRYFKGVQDQKDQKGEIFGMKNLFSYQNDNIVLRDIVNKTNVAESRVGVQVMDVAFEFDAEEDYTLKSEDEAMSQLTAEICGESKEEESTKKKERSAQKHDPVQAILASAGVEYTHLNNEVIGSSKVEEQLSLNAKRIHNDPDADFQVFDRTFTKPLPTAAPNSHFDVLNGDGLRYNPPDAVKRRQFCSMARHFGYPNATDFALVVENMTQAQRRACLEKWYRERWDIVQPKAEMVKAEVVKGESIKDKNQG